MESISVSQNSIVFTPCPVCQMNVEVYQNHINKKYKTNFKMPVVYYSTLMSVAYGKSGKEAGLDGQMIKARQLEDIAGK
jgi:heterodisulfide reductase subunit B